MSASHRPSFLAVTSWCTALLVATSSAFAASYVVTTDRETVRRADAIVIASALSSYPQEGANGAIETVTVISIEEVLKGSVSTPTIEIHEPGGRLGKRIRIVAGAPTFKEGDRLLLFLREYAPGKWASSDFALGKFSFESDDVGEKLLVRQEGDINGWDVDMKQHREGRRAAAKFLDFVRTEAKGGMGRQDYAVAKHPLVVSRKTLVPRSLIASTSPTSYTFPNDVLGYRWNVFPAAVTYYYYNITANPTNALAAMNGALGSWTNDTGSNVNLVNGGTDPGPGTPLGAAGNGDGRNSFRFEIDLTLVAGPFSCNANSYGGVVGFGGVNANFGTHLGPAGEMFNTITEGDVDMNLNVLNCTLLGVGNMTSAATHEAGHSIGFRHSDKNRDGSACTPSVTNECSSSAIMTSVVPNGLAGALQTWDINAVRAVYPQGVTPAPAAPVISATAADSTHVSIAWSAVTGATSYDVYRRAGPGAFGLVINTGSAGYADTVSSNAAYLYKVVAKNTGGSSPDSNIDLATAVIYTDDPLVSTTTTIKAVHLTQLRTAVDAVRALAGLAVGSYTDPTPSGVTVKSVHVTQLRTNLDAAFTGIGFAGGGYTNSAAAGTTVRALDFQEIRNRMR